MTSPIQTPLPGLPGLLPIAIAPPSEDDGGVPRIEGTMTVREEHLAPTGYLHAASIVALADTACGYGCLASLPPGKAGFTTIELKVNYLGTARVGETIHVAASALHRGGTTQVWDAAVRLAAPDGDEGRTIASFRCTQFLLDRA